MTEIAKQPGVPPSTYSSHVEAVLQREAAWRTRDKRMTTRAWFTLLLLTLTVFTLYLIAK